MAASAFMAWTAVVTSIRQVFSGPQLEDVDIHSTTLFLCPNTSETIVINIKNKTSMKKKLLLLMTLCLLSGINALAYDALLDGIYYNFSGDEATVTSESSIPWFYGNGYEGEVVIPETVTYQGHIYSVTSIGDDAFSSSMKLTSVTIPNSVTSIGNSDFSGCSGLISITIPNSVTSIGNSAFSGCSGLISITIPNSVTSIGSSAFSGCTGLISITVKQGNSKYDSRDKCNAIIETASNTLIAGCMNTIIPEGVTSIGSSAFEGCSGLTSVTIPEGVTSIGDEAFSWCSGLTSVTIPEGVTSIGSGAFLGCTGLTTITIPSSVTNIGSSVFKNSNLRNVLVKCATPPDVDVYGDPCFSKPTLYHTTLYVPAGCWDAYAYDDYWFQFINIRETATSEGQVSMQQAYTLMDAEAFTYSVYDPVNDCIGTVNSVSGINEDNPNHSWQVIEAGGEHYLYNLGARKFVASAGGSYTLTDEPVPVGMTDGDNGIILGTQTTKQWALVSNENLSVQQAIITGLDDLRDSKDSKDLIVNLAGQRLSKPQKGINITGGKKVLVR